MKNNNPTKQTKQNKPKIEKENKKAKKNQEYKVDLLEQDIKKNFDCYLKGIKFCDKKCEGYDDFNNQVASLLELLNVDMTEENCRILKLDKNHKIDQMEIIEKYSLIGKIGSGKTFLLDENTTKGAKIENIKLSRLSLKANNCVLKGKWIFEVQLLTNMEMILGWTQFNSCFTDCMSYTVLEKGNYGYRNTDKTAFEDNLTRILPTNLWNIGDVIGVGINLDQKNIEYFRNGISLGVFFSNIPVGENKAYFPSVLLGYKQKIYVNFGQEKLNYNYPHSYNSLDMPEGEYRNYLKVSKSMLDFLNVYYFKYVYDMKIPKSQVCSLFSELFLTLNNITLEDECSIKEAFIPFLMKIHEPAKMDDFLRRIYVSNKSLNKNEVFNRLINCLCCEIEKLAMKNIYENKSKYIEMFSLLNKLIKLRVHSQFIEEWLKSITFFKNLESILSFNFSDTQEFIKILEEARKEFINNSTNKKLKLDAKKFSRYYIKFFSVFRNNFCSNNAFKCDPNSKSDGEDKKSNNYEFRSFLKENKLNMPDFVFEKIKEFLKICLFKTQDKSHSYDSKNKITSLYVKSKEISNIQGTSNEGKHIYSENEKTPSSKNTSVTFRNEVLDNIFKNFKAISHNENYSYMEVNWKLYDLNDLNILQFYMLLFDISIEKIIDNENFYDQITINNWIDKKNPFQKGNSNDIFLGGTINTVKLELFNEISDSKFCDKTKSNSVWNDIFNYIFYASEGLLVKCLNNIVKSFESVIREDPLRAEIKTERDVSRKFIYLTEIMMRNLSPRMIKSIISTLYFTVHTLNQFLDNKESILFAIPKNVFYLPYQIQKFCNTLLNFTDIKEFSEDLIYKVPESQKGNKLIIFKTKDDFCHLMLKFYLTVFQSDKIKNPELRESFNSIVNFFIINSQYSNYLLNTCSLIELFVKGILIDIDKYYLSQVATINILKLVDRFSLTDCKCRENKGLLNLDKFKSFSQENPKLFESLCGKVFSNLNKYMSDFMQEISNTYNILYTNSNSNVLINTINKKDAIKKFISNSIVFSEYLVLLEILIKINSSMFMNQRNLLFTNLLNFFTNISTRLANSNSYKKIKDILTYNVDNANLNQPKINAQAALMNDVFRGLSYPIISIFNDLNSAKAFSDENEFSKQLSFSDFIDFQNFKNILDECKNGNNAAKQLGAKNAEKNSENVDVKPEFNIDEDINKYKETINMLIEKKKVKTKMKMSEEEWKDKNDNEKLCFICFTRNMDTVISPCKHEICNICLLQYLVDKKNCFLCAQPIKSYKIIGTKEDIHID